MRAVTFFGLVLIANSIKTMEASKLETFATIVCVLLVVDIVELIFKLTKQK